MRTYTISAFADEAGGALDVQLEALKRNGISHIEMRMVDGKNASNLTADEAVAVRAKLDVAGVTLSALGSPFGKIRADEPFEPHLAQFKHALMLCKLLGATRMRIFSFYIPEGEDPAKYRSEVIRRMGVMLDAADEWGIRLLHENEKGIYGDIASRCDDLLKHVGGRLGCIFDPANFIQSGQETLSAWEMLKPYIEYMHIKDSLPDGNVVPSGCGAGNVPQIVRNRLYQRLCEKTDLLAEDALIINATHTHSGPRFTKEMVSIWPWPCSRRLPWLPPICSSPG